jgi:hypothetical protein
MASELLAVETIAEMEIDSTQPEVSWAAPAQSLPQHYACCSLRGRQQRRRPLAGGLCELANECDGPKAFQKCRDRNFGGPL